MCGASFTRPETKRPRVAGWILRQMQQLYAIESRLRETRAGPSLRAAIRGSQSRMIMERLYRALVRLKTSRRFLPRSLMGAAIDYALSQWPTLLVYLDDGRMEIDNNLVLCCARHNTSYAASRLMPRGGLAPRCFQEHSNIR